MIFFSCFVLFLFSLAFLGLNHYGNLQAPSGVLKLGVSVSQFHPFYLNPFLMSVCFSGVVSYRKPWGFFLFVFLNRK